MRVRVKVVDVSALDRAGMNSLMMTNGHCGDADDVADTALVEEVDRARGALLGRAGSSWWSAGSGYVAVVVRGGCGSFKRGAARDSAATASARRRGASPHRCPPIRVGAGGGRRDQLGATE